MSQNRSIMAKYDQKTAFLFCQHPIVNYWQKLLILMLIINGDINITFPDANHKFEYDWTLHLTTF